MLDKRSLADKTGFVFDAVRFLLAGGLNTILSLALYQVLVTFYSAQLSYLVSWLFGILFVAIVYPSKVFPGATKTYWKNCTTVLIYISVYLCSAQLLAFFSSYDINPRGSIFLVMIFSVCLNFTLMWWVYRVFDKKN